MLQAKARTAALGMFAAALGLFLGAAPLQAQVTLRYQFKPGESLDYQMQQKMEIAMNIGGVDNTVKTDLLMGMTWKVLHVEPDGKAKIAQKVDHIRMAMDSSLGKVDYDSRTAREPEGVMGKAVGPIFNALAGSEFTLVMDKLGEPSDVQIPEKLLEIMKKANAPGIGEMFSPESLKQMLNQGGMVLSREPVKKGDTWTRKMNAKIPFGSMHVVYNMTYEGTTEGGNMQKIAVAPTINFEADPNAPVTMKLKSSTGKGEALFDNNAGRLVEVSIVQNMEMQISAGGQDIAQHVKTHTLVKLKR